VDCDVGVRGTWLSRTDFGWQIAGRHASVCAFPQSSNIRAIGLSWRDCIAYRRGQAALWESFASGMAGGLVAFWGLRVVNRVRIRRRRK
jgi:hypothetical protein